MTYLLLIVAAISTLSGESTSGLTLGQGAYLIANTALGYANAVMVPLAIIGFVALVLLIAGIVTWVGSSSEAGCGFVGCLGQMTVFLLALPIGNFIAIKLLENIVGSLTVNGVITDPTRFWVSVIIILLIGAT